MLDFRNKTSLFKRYEKDEKGNVTLVFSICTVAVVGLMGLGMDFSTRHSAESRSQSIADQTALTAAIYMKDNDAPPTNIKDGYTPGTHSAAALGYDYKSWVTGGADNVDVVVTYDDNAKEARVTVEGSTTTNFGQIFGTKTLPFKAEAVVSYLQVDEKHPASIALVLDNSGSMAWDDKLANADGSSPDNAEPRIDGLEFSVKRFTKDLKDRLGTEDSTGLRTIRMGMLPYSSDIITDNRVNMKWGYLSNGEVERMTPSGSTNSNPPMAQAMGWMNGENAMHRAEADRMSEGYVEPLKFVIFMSDGQNTLGHYEFTEDDEAPVYWRHNGGGSWSGIWATQYNNESGYIRGHLRRSTDQLTINSCNTLKSQGTEIFTIGYALEVGSYNRNYSDTSTSTAYVNLWNQTNAYNLLQSCASKAENFSTADDTTELEAAFDRIQNSIVKELIRIKS